MADRPLHLLVGLLREQNRAGNGWLVKCMTTSLLLAVILLLGRGLEGATWLSATPIGELLRVLMILFVVGTPLAVITILYLRLVRALFEAKQRGDDA